MFLVLLLGNGIAEAAGWRVNPQDFEFSASVTAILEVDWIQVEGEGNLVGAFVGDECRGVAAPIFALDAWIYFITIFADVDGEIVHFKAYIAAEGAVVDVDEVIVFQANRVFGDPTHPLALHATVDRPLPPVISGIFDGAGAVPGRFSLSQSYPNPFNPETTIRFEVVRSGPVRLCVYALTGQRVRILMDGTLAAGRHAAVWDGRDEVGRRVASGAYLCRLEGMDYQAVQKMLLVR